VSHNARTLVLPLLNPSDSVYAAVDGPSVKVKTPGKPQLLLSVAGAHSTA
jgi:hypothetical protein